MRILRSLTLFFLLCSLCTSVWAQRIVFQRGDALYVADKTGKNPRRLMDIENVAGSLWAVAPDGRRLAFLMRPKTGLSTGNEASGLGVREATVFISDFNGRRKKRLFTTENLRDRQGRIVTEAAISPTESTLLAEWEPTSLTWSGDSKTLYLSCERIHDPKGKATFAVDALNGAALIDAEGRWKSIAPMAEVEGRGALLVGSGWTSYAPASGGESYFEPLTVVNLVEQTRGAVVTVPAGASETPPYATAHAPALGPGNRIIAFGNGNGLWTTDKYGKGFRRLLEGSIRRPRFEPGISEAMGVFCLLPRPNTGDKSVYDLYFASFPESPNNPAPPPALVMQTVDWFDIVPD